MQDIIRFTEVHPVGPDQTLTSTARKVAEESQFAAIRVAGVACTHVLYTDEEGLTFIYVVEPRIGLFGDHLERWLDAEREFQAWGYPHISMVEQLARQIGIQGWVHRAAMREAATEMDIDLI